MRTPEEETGINFNNPVIQVMHRNLRRDGEEAPFRSRCPFCFNGILFVRRDDETFRLLSMDRCVLCGQAVEYLDIKNGLLHKDDGSKLE